jgi:hypothetical protein
VTTILNGNLDKVLSDLLIELLGALGYRVKVSVSRKARDEPVDGKVATAVFSTGGLINTEETQKK